MLTNFKQQFPQKISSLSISKHLLASILNQPNVSGIRFMYGILDPDNPQTCLVLMPCSHDMVAIKSSLPNIKVNEAGYFLHNGEQVSLERTWKILFNHVMFEYKQNPQQDLKTIHRGDFWGINMLNNFINNPLAENLQFNIGFSPTDNEFTKGIHPVLEPLDKNDNSLNIWMNFTSPCPQACGEGECTSSAAYNATHDDKEEFGLNKLREFRNDLWVSKDGELVEMYYHISPIITASIRKQQNAKEIYAEISNDYLQPCLDAIEEGKTTEAVTLYKEVFNKLVTKYAL